MIKPLQVYLKTASSNQKTAWEDAGEGGGLDESEKEKKKRKLMKGTRLAWS